MSLQSLAQPPLCFVSPIDGDVLFEVQDGTERDGVLTTEVTLSAPPHTCVTVNGIAADYDVDGTYWAFYIGNDYGMTGVDMTTIEAGATYAFKVTK